MGQRWTTASVVLAATLLPAAGSPPAGAAKTPADAVATHAFLAAGYAREQAVVAALPASTAAVEGAAGRIGGECPGVLAGSPAFPPFQLTTHRVGARQRGELIRENDQSLDLSRELTLALAMALVQPDRQADLGFASAVEPLQWSNPEIAEAVHLEVASLEERLEPPPNVCVDMRAWVTSGYRILPAETKELFARRRAAAKRGASVRPVLSLLAPYESPADKILVHETEQLTEQEIRPVKAVVRILASLRETLGIARPAPKRRSKLSEPGFLPPLASIAPRAARAAGRYPRQDRQDRRLTADPRRPPQPKGGSKRPTVSGAPAPAAGRSAPRTTGSRTAAPRSPPPARRR